MSPRNSFHIRHQLNPTSNLAFCGLLFDFADTVESGEGFGDLRSDVCHVDEGSDDESSEEDVAEKLALGHPVTDDGVAAHDHGDDADAADDDG